MALKEELTSAEPGPDLSYGDHEVGCLGCFKTPCGDSFWNNHKLTYICHCTQDSFCALQPLTISISIGHCKLWFSHGVKKNSVEEVQLHTFGSSRF
jgi:hypothetical protein